MSNTEQHNDLNLIGFIREIWAAKVFLAVGLCVGVVLAFGFLSVAQPRVEARMIIGPAQPMDISIQAKYQDGQNSYIRAPQTDTSLGEGISNFTRFKAMMRGASVARLLLRDSKIVDGLSADKAYDFSDGLNDVTPAQLGTYIAARVDIDPFGQTALETLIYQHSDPVFAAYFLQQIHRVSDQLIRADLRGQADERIAYLERVIGKTTNPEQRRIMTNLLLEQERLRMMVSMDAPVAASLIEPAAVSALAVWPDVFLVYGGLGFIGLMIGYLVFGVVYYRDEVVPVSDTSREKNIKGEQLQHKPKRPLKYGSWFQNAPDNANDLPENAPGKRRLKGASDAAE